MSAENTVNDQILDSTSFAINKNIGHAHSQTTAMLDAVMAETIGMIMHNAVTTQHNGQMIGNASVTATCAKILSVPLAKAPTTASKPIELKCTTSTPTTSTTSTTSRPTSSEPITSRPTPSKPAAGTTGVPTPVDHVVDAKAGAKADTTKPDVEEAITILKKLGKPENNYKNDKQNIENDLKNIEDSLNDI